MGEFYDRRDLNCFNASRTPAEIFPLPISAALSRSAGYHVMYERIVFGIDGSRAGRPRRMVCRLSSRRSFFIGYSNPISSRHAATASVTVLICLHICPYLPAGQSHSQRDSPSSPRRTNRIVYGRPIIRYVWGPVCSIPHSAKMSVFISHLLFLFGLCLVPCSSIVNILYHK